MIRRPHVPRVYRYQVFISSSYCCRCSLQQVPRSYCCTKEVSPLDSSLGRHLPTRAASASASRGGCFDPKRAATAPGCRAYSASREHRVRSLTVVGYDQTRAHGSSRTRSSSTTPRPDDGTHTPHRLPPMPHREFLAEGRTSVGLCTTASVYVRSR